MLLVVLIAQLILYPVETFSIYIIHIEIHIYVYINRVSPEWVEVSEKCAFIASGAPGLFKVRVCDGGISSQLLLAFSCATL